MQSSPAANMRLVILVADPESCAGARMLERCVRAARSLGPKGLLEVHGARQPGELAEQLRRQGLIVTTPHSDSDPLRVSPDALPEYEDLTELEPPQPAERVLRALSKLAPGEVYLARLPRYPRWLVPQLAERPVDWHIEERPDTTAILWAQAR